MQLLDGHILDAAREGDWTVVIVGASILTLGLASGVLAWLKGRKAAAVLTWLLWITAVGFAMVPISWLEGAFAIDSAALTWIVVGIVSAALAIALIAVTRLAKPSSWWAQRRYDNDTYAKAIERHRWTRVRPR